MLIVLAPGAIVLEWNVRGHDDKLAGPGMWDSHIMYVIYMFCAQVLTVVIQLSSLGGCKFIFLYPVYDHNSWQSFRRGFWYGFDTLSSRKRRYFMRACFLGIAFDVGGYSVFRGKLFSNIVSSRRMR